MTPLATIREALERVSVSKRERQVALAALAEVEATLADRPVRLSIHEAEAILYNNRTIYDDHAALLAARIAESK